MRKILMSALVVAGLSAAFVAVDATPAEAGCVTVSTSNGLRLPDGTLVGTGRETYCVNGFIEWLSRWF